MVVPGIEHWVRDLVACNQPSQRNIIHPKQFNLFNHMVNYICTHCLGLISMSDLLYINGMFFVCVHVNCIINETG